MIINIIKRNLVFFLTILISSTLLANVSKQEVGVGHLMLGASYSTYSGEDWALQGGYINDNFLATVGFGWENSKTSTGSEFSILELRSHIGLRKKLSHRLSFDYGLFGSYGFIIDNLVLYVLKTIVLFGGREAIYITQFSYFDNSYY